MRTAACLVVLITCCTSVSALAQPPPPYPRQTQPPQQAPYGQQPQPAQQAPAAQQVQPPQQAPYGQQPAQQAPSGQQAMPPQQTPLPPQQTPYPQQSQYPQQAPYPQQAQPYPGAPAQGLVGGTEYGVAFGPLTEPSWSESDERWYRRNRAWSLSGKILTVVGVALVIAFVSANEDNEFAAGPGVLVQAAGQITWAGADLRGALQMNRRGFDVPKASGIVSMIGAVLCSPVNWIAGPIQSARIRQAHDSVTYASTRSPTFTAFGTGFRTTF